MDCGYEITGAVPPGFTAFTLQRLHEPIRRRDAVQAQRVDRITRHIDMHLDDPALTARSTARALGMSVRSLHLALAGTPHSFGDLLLQRRLGLCRALLAEWDSADSIADLAFACGFNSLSSFYRAFRAHFGTCPRAVRAAA